MFMDWLPSLIFQCLDVTDYLSLEGRDIPDLSLQETVLSIGPWHFKIRQEASDPQHFCFL